MITIDRLHHVQIACPAGAEEPLRPFYGGVVGMVEVAKPPVLATRGGGWFRSPNGRVELHLGVEADFRPARKAHPGLLTTTHAHLRALAERLTAAGYPVRWDDGFLPGYHRFYSQDPFGNRLEFLAAEDSR